MTSFTQRPWGRLAWTLDRLGDNQWDVLGCLAAEERALAVPQAVRGGGRLRQLTLMQIDEPPGHPGQSEIDLRKEVRRADADREFPGYVAEEHRLLERYDRIVGAARAFAARSGGSVILDITCLPKRFFFALLRTLLRDRTSVNVVVTYAKAASYGTESLYEDALSPDYLPLFGPSFDEEETETDAGLVVVGLGFDAPGLLQILDRGDIREVEIYFPYPAPPPFFARNWDFLRHAAHSIDRRHMRVVGVSSMNVPAVYDELMASTRGGVVGATLAPYGPKPVSLAMCLYASTAGNGRTSVLYTQPRYYSPSYSAGIATDDAGVIAYAYPVRLNGVDLY